MEVACGRDGKREGAMNRTIPVENRESSRDGLDHKEQPV